MNYRISSFFSKTLLISLILIFSNCAGSRASSQNDPFKESSRPISDSDSQENLDSKKLYVYLKQQKDEISELVGRIDSLNTIVFSQNENFVAVSNSLDSLKSDFNQQATVEEDDTQVDVLNTMIHLRNKVKILEDRAFYTDSLYFEIVNDLVQIENKIVSLTTSYKEMIQLKTSGSIKELPSISDEEYTARYIESLSFYQNGEWNKSLDGFTYLIAVNSSHDLADNCQYWVGEVYYGLKDYKRSITEFEKVFSFPGTNKADDAQYKLGLCYLNINNNSRALDEFTKVKDYYSNSEYYKKAIQYIKQLRN
ncbi:MAG: tetratricopeptide repeat protein [Candidatus Marinimicrobia bacterium]|jgi:TolA-binding protein|nr:tetratricopeptide repeat protein [Candidatus Neomarinimicrobiota bacterium]|tara:strand:- start:474 stop:1400 length:927 start_codon:yes stop_codon:yes gene_type:complete